MLLNLEQAKHLLRRTNTTKNVNRQRRAVAQDPDVFPISMWPNAVVPYLIWFTGMFLPNTFGINFSKQSEDTVIPLTEPPLFEIC